MVGDEIRAVIAVTRPRGVRRPAATLAVRPAPHFARRIASAQLAAVIGAWIAVADATAQAKVARIGATP